MPKAAKQQAIRKSFWVFPHLPADSAKQTIEEADKLTAVLMDKTFRPHRLTGLHATSSFLTQFFAQFTDKHCRFVSFLRRAEEGRQPQANKFNPLGYRHVYGLVFDDFELLQSLSLEVSRSMLLVESAYPFRSFFEKLLRTAFQELRIRRLATFGAKFLLGDSPAEQLTESRHYDASGTKHILDELGKGFFAKMFTARFDAGIAFPEEHVAQSFSFRPLVQYAHISDCLESNPS